MTYSDGSHPPPVSERGGGHAGDHPDADDYGTALRRLLIGPSINRFRSGLKDRAG